MGLASVGIFSICGSPVLFGSVGRVIVAVDGAVAFNAFRSKSRTEYLSCSRLLVQLRYELRQLTTVAWLFANPLPSGNEPGRIVFGPIVVSSCDDELRSQVSRGGTSVRDVAAAFLHVVVNTLLFHHLESEKCRMSSVGIKSCLKTRLRIGDRSDGRKLKQFCISKIVLRQVLDS